MPDRGILVTGTDTEVGKTVVTCALIEKARETGLTVVGMKPVAAGMIQYQGGWINEDVRDILRTSGEMVQTSAVNPYSYRPFIAPHIAAAKAGEEVSLDRIEDCYRVLCRDADLVVVEGAGGLMTPLNNSETFLDLATRLSLPVIVVVAIRLGCINHALLTVHALRSSNVRMLGWIANFTQPDEGTGGEIIEALAARLDAPCLGIVPHQPSGINQVDIDINQTLNFDL